MVCYILTTYAFRSSVAYRLFRANDRRNTVFTTKGTQAWFSFHRSLRDDAGFQNLRSLNPTLRTTDCETSAGKNMSTLRKSTKEIRLQITTRAGPICMAHKANRYEGPSQQAAGALSVLASNMPSLWIGHHVVGNEFVVDSGRYRVPKLRRWSAI